MQLLSASAKKAMKHTVSQLDRHPSACTQACSVGYTRQGRRNFGLAAVHYRRALLHFDYTFAETEDSVSHWCCRYHARMSTWLFWF